MDMGQLGPLYPIPALGRPWHHIRIAGSYFVSIVEARGMDTIRFKRLRPFQDVR